MVVKERARRQKRSAGDLLSELAREALNHHFREESEANKPKSFYGFDPLPPRGKKISNELIDKLHEEDLG